MARSSTCTTGACRGANAPERLFRTLRTGCTDRHGTDPELCAWRDVGALNSLNVANFQTSVQCIGAAVRRRRGGGYPGPPSPQRPPPPVLPFQCLRLTAKILLRRLWCQEN